MKKLIVKDNNGISYVVHEPSQFKQHLLDSHTVNGKPDFSLHEENGHYFTATTKLLNEVIEFIKKSER